MDNTIMYISPKRNVICDLLGLFLIDLELTHNKIAQDIANKDATTNCVKRSPLKIKKQITNVANMKNNFCLFIVFSLCDLSIRLK